MTEIIVRIAAPEGKAAVSAEGTIAWILLVALLISVIGIVFAMGAFV